MSTKERTLAVIKPGAFRSRHTGPIIADIQARGFNIVEMRMVRFTENQAKAFYAEHDGRAHFAGLIEHTVSAPSVVLVLEGTVAKPNVIQGWRDAMGPTDPSLGTATAHLRAKYGYGMPGNALHGSDSVEAFEREMAVAFHWSAARAIIAGLAQDLAKLVPQAAPGSSLVQPSGQTVAAGFVANLDAAVSSVESAVAPAVPGSSDTAGA